MSALLPDASSCCTPCEEVPSIQVPGPAGADGADGDQGIDGVNAYTLTVAGFLMPAEGATVTVSVSSSDWIGLNQMIFVQSAGYMKATAIPNSASVTLRNEENTATAAYTENAAPGTSISAGVKVCPAGLQGPTGSAAGALLAANNLSDVSTPATARTNLGLGTMATQAASAVAITGGAVGSLTNVAVAATIRTDISAQPLDAELTAIAGLVSAADRLPYFTALGAAALATFTAAGRALVDDADAAAQRTTLGLNRAAQDILIYEHQALTTVNGGDFTSGAWRTVPLSAEVQDTGTHGSIAANVITLAAGTYRFRGRVAGYAVDDFQCRLWNVDTAAVIAYGANARAGAADNVQTYSLIEGRVTLAIATQVRLEAQCQTTNAGDGFGKANSFGGTEIYSGITFERDSG